MSTSVNYLYEFFDPLVNARILHLESRQFQDMHDHGFSQKFNISNDFHRFAYFKKLSHIEPEKILEIFKYPP